MHFLLILEIKKCLSLFNSGLLDACGDDYNKIILLRKWLHGAANILWSMNPNFGQICQWSIAEYCYCYWTDADPLGDILRGLCVHGEYLFD